MEHGTEKPHIHDCGHMKMLKDPKLPLLGYRHFYALCCCLTFLIINAQSIGIGIAIVAMVNHTAVQEESLPASNGSTCPVNINYTGKQRPIRVDGPFTWSSELQGYVLGVEFFGFLMMQAVASKLSEFVSNKPTIVCATFVCALSTIVVPFVSVWSVYCTIVVFLIRGMAQGAMVPPTFSMMGKWFPDSERSILVSFSMTGLDIGILAGGLATGLICDTPVLGWQATFYLLGSFIVLVAVLFAFTYVESPVDHPNLSETELQHIMGDKDKLKSTEQNGCKVPWRKIFSSKPVYALIIGVFGNYWINTYFLSIQPTYLATILHLNLTNNGLTSSLPTLLKIIVAWCSSFVSDWLSRNSYVDRSKLRKGCHLLGSLGCTASLVGIYIVRCDSLIYTILSTLSLFFIGTALPGCLVAGMDMTPRFAGPMMGVISAIASTSNFIVPILAGYITKNGTIDEWNTFFLITIAVILTCTLVFITFGTAQVQPWNFLENSHDNNKDRKEVITMIENNIHLSKVIY